MRHIQISQVSAIRWQGRWAWVQANGLRMAVGLSFMAEIVHLLVLPLQYEIFFLYGIFFLLAAMGQGLTAVLLLFTPGLRVLRWTTRLNAFLVGSYVITHTLGVITGIGFTRLSVDGFGVVVTLGEVAIVSLMVIERQQRQERAGSSMQKARHWPRAFAQIARWRGRRLQDEFPATRAGQG